MTPLIDPQLLDDRHRVLVAFEDGLVAVETSAAAIDDWSVPTPCADWRAVDLAGHVFTIVRYFHRLLDSALVGSPRHGLPRGPELQLMNARDMAELQADAGPHRIGEFLRRARDYGARIAAADWQMTLGNWDGIGPLTLAEHSGLAIGEWHLHAWDLGRSGGLDHRPADPTIVAAGRMVLPGPPPEGDPWEATLTWSGRTLPRRQERS